VEKKSSFWLAVPEGGLIMVRQLKQDTGQSPLDAYTESREKPGSEAGQ